MKALTLSLALATGLLVQATPANADPDTLLVDRAQSEVGMTLPTRGTSMATIESRFGAPSVKHAAVSGPNSHRFNPPITRWDYPTFSVYFEYSTVIDAVLSKASPSEIGPAPVRQ